MDHSLENLSPMGLSKGHNFQSNSDDQIEFTCIPHVKTIRILNVAITYISHEQTNNQLLDVSAIAFLISLYLRYWAATGRMSAKLETWRLCCLKKSFSYDRNI